MTLVEGGGAVIGISRDPHIRFDIKGGGDRESQQKIVKHETKFLFRNFVSPSFPQLLMLLLDLLILRVGQLFSHFYIPEPAEATKKKTFFFNFDSNSAPAETFDFLRFLFCLISYLLFKQISRFRINFKYRC